jgi:uncharacterized Fe-S cluster protein YjdI
MHPQLQKLRNYAGVFDLYILTFTIICTTSVFMVQGNAQVLKQNNKNEVSNTNLSQQEIQTVESIINKINPTQEQENILEIGDRVWFDNDRDGVQSEVDTSLPGVKVSLYNANTIISSAITDDDGKYIFSTFNDVDTEHRKYNLSLKFGTEYRISLDSTQPTLQGFAPTLLNMQENDLVDSDGVKSNELISIVFNTAGSGKVDHGFDFGFTTGSFGNMGGLYPNQPDANPCTTRETKQNNELETKCGGFGGAAPETCTTNNNCSTSQNPIGQTTTSTTNKKLLIRTGGK